MSYYIPCLDDYGDEALPLDKLLHRQRRVKPPIRACEVDPITPERRLRVLQAHCCKKGKRHEFVVETREGTKCLWCGIVLKGEMH
jgi:hypothetical protein